MVGKTDPNGEAPRITITPQSGKLGYQRTSGPVGPKSHVGWDSSGDMSKYIDHTMKHFAARQAPEMRDKMIGNMDHVVRALAPYDNNIGGFGADDPAKATVEICTILREGLTYCDLWWTSRDITDLVSHAWQTIPSVTLTEDLPPEPDGLVLFEHTMYGQDAEAPDRQVAFHAVQWYTSHLSILDGGMCVSITAWQQATDGLWTPLGRSDWPYGWDVDQPIPPENHGYDNPTRNASIIEDRRLLATIWLLSRQTRAVEVTDFKHDRASVRQYTRKRQAVPRIKVIDVRAPKGAPSGESRNVEWKHRWLVRGHWRQQAFGPNRQYRRPQWIAPFSKGPSDKPLLIHDEVVKGLM